MKKITQYTFIICIFISLLITVKASQNPNAVTGAYMSFNTEDTNYNSILLLYSRKFSPWWGVSGGYMEANIDVNYAGSKTKYTSSDNTFQSSEFKATVDISDKAYLALFDFFLFQGDFRFSAGLNYNQGKYSAEADVAGNTTIGNTNYNFSTGGGFSMNQNVNSFGSGVFGLAYDYKFSQFPLIFGFQFYYYLPPKGRIEASDIKLTGGATVVVINDSDLKELADALNKVYEVPKMLLAFSIGYSF